MTATRWDTDPRDRNTWQHHVLLVIGLACMVFSAIALLTANWQLLPAPVAGLTIANWLRHQVTERELWRWTAQRLVYRTTVTPQSPGKTDQEVEALLAKHARLRRCSVCSSWQWAWNLDHGICITHWNDGWNG